MERFLNLHYFFVALPDPNYHFTKITLLIGIALILLGFGLGYWRKKRLTDPIAKKILRKYPSRLELYGFLVLMLLVFRELGVPYLSMRIWWVVLLVFFLCTFAGLPLIYSKKYRHRSERVRKNSSTLKYLPKKKH